MPVENNKHINGVKHEVDLTETGAVTVVCHIEVNIGPGGPNDIEINLNVPEGHNPQVALRINHTVHTGHRISRETQTEAQARQKTYCRPKRICTSKAIDADEEPEECGATDCCYDPLSEETKVRCAGPGCNAKYHLSCVGLGVMPTEAWFCDVDCRLNAGQPVRKRRRIGVTA
ncbi:hypothetical protein DFH94DRAFT_34242 [Russula ochroleuca]|uniref:Zinc finger PHD-type domain-containing protein n=1 Tax=Russula ochroleuca TaxID=152965 RepID=A0A9P5MUD2_9AGAM|nr:hypothetical protein DFH94DRAFT_34242 [Russula ochroleuca]